MRRRSVILVVLAALLSPASAAAQAETVELMPSVTYTREVRWVRGGPLVVHSIVAPKPGGLYALKPALSNEQVLGRETVSQMQRRLSGQATLAGVNGDLFAWETGHPSGILMRDGILESRPTGARSSLGITLDGTLRVGRIDFFGTWHVGEGERFPLGQFNRPIEKDENVVGLYTPSWGGRTPRAEGAVDVVLAGFPIAVPNADLPAQIVEVRRGGGTLIPAGGAVLQAQGFWTDQLLAEAVPGETMTVSLILNPWWEDAAHAIGGGPVIVRDGRPVSRTNEAFTPAQLLPRHPRTGVGQLADGRVILVAVDGRARWSTGVRLWELSLELIRLGAVTAMSLDAGGSTTIAFDGEVLNTPSDGAERPVGDALMIFYYGAYAPEPRHAVVSPNGDGVAEAQRLAYKVVRPSTVDVNLVAPDGTTVWHDDGARDPGVYRVRPAMLEQQGQYQWIVGATDADGQTSGQTRSFALNNTLGFLRLSKSRLKLMPKRGGELAISFELASRAWLLVTVVDDGGRIVRRVYARTNDPGPQVVQWNGRNGRGELVATGSYTVHVQAKNDLGLVSLEKPLAVRLLPRR